jgi:hypothetical protein
MMSFPIDSFGDAFLAGEVMGFIEDHTRTCRRCGRDSLYTEDDFEEYDDDVCPRCRDDYDYDKDDDFD